MHVKTVVERVQTVILRVGFESILKIETKESAMRQVPADKYNIAWFKLAEFVARGEKERALGIYRLLLHSFNDRAFSYQLEGDLLWSFSDEQAIDKYMLAAQLYFKEGRLNEAIAIYELLVSLRPNHEQYIHQLIELYQTIKNTQRLVATTENLCDLMLERSDWATTHQFIMRCEKITSREQCVPLYQKYALALVKDPKSPQQEVKKAIQAFMDRAIEDTQTAVLQQFLTTVEMINKDYYQIACGLLKK